MRHLELLAPARDMHIGIAAIDCGADAVYITVVLYFSLISLIAFRILSFTNTTVILTTHDIGDIEELCNRIIIIDEGKKIYDGGIEELKATYDSDLTEIVKEIYQHGMSKGEVEA